MAVINIDDAYILNETGAQVDKVTGLFTKDEGTTNPEKAFAQLNIGTAGSNRNLLDNGFFTVRQRGNGPWTTAVYTADRWKNTGANQSTTLTSQGLVIQQVTNGYDGVEQTLSSDLSAALVGSALTLSINCLAVSGTYRYRMRFFNGGSLISAKFGGITSAGLYSVTMDAVPANTNSIVVDFLTNTGRAGDTITVAAIKLEKGTVSTLANDAPPEPSIASIPCYENFLRLKGAYAPVGYAIAVSTTLALVVIPTPVPMRAVPKASLSGTLYFNAGTPFAVTGLNSTGTTFGVNQITQQVNGSFDVGKVYLAQFRDATSYIDLSADL